MDNNLTPEQKKYKYDKLYMDITYRVSSMSYATREQVGCIAVKDGRILSMGWNGTPEGYDNECEYYDEERDSYITKPEVLHAELNCLAKLAKSSESSEGCTLYITLSPCMHCAKIIAQSGVKKVIYSKLYSNTEGINLLNKLGVECKPFETRFG